jgi:hypothetical protein
MVIFDIIIYKIINILTGDENLTGWRKRVQSLGQNERSIGAEYYIDPMRFLKTRLTKSDFS